jgi:endonuclease III
MIRVRTRSPERPAAQPQPSGQAAAPAPAPAVPARPAEPKPAPQPAPPVRVRANEEKRQRSLRSKLVELAHAYQHTAAPPPLTRHEEANALVTDFAAHPHAFILACVASPMLHGDGGCLLPCELRSRLGHFDMPRLALLSKADWLRVVSEPPICAAGERLAQAMFRAVQHIHRFYDDNAAAVWEGKPSSAALVSRLMEFDLTPATSVAAANTLVRDFGVPVADRYSIDVTVDGDVRRIMTRLGLVEEGARHEALLYKTRELNPQYPGLLDLPLLEVARTVCHAEFPSCEKCPLVEACRHARERRVRPGMPPLPFENGSQ